MTISIIGHSPSESFFFGIWTKPAYLFTKQFV